MPKSRGVREKRGVGVLSWVLIVLACVLTPLGALSTWAKYEIGDADRYVAAMAPLASDPDVQQAVSEVMSEEIIKQADLDVGLLQEAIEGFLSDAVLSFTETDAFRSAWNAANRAAHDAVQDALNRGADGAVTIDLAPIIEQLKEQLVADGVTFAEEIPVERTEVTVMNAQDVASLRKGFHMLQIAGIWLPLAAVLCALTGIALGVRRRRAIAATALGMAVGAALLVLALAITRRLTLGDLPPDISRPAVAATYDALTSSLLTAAWVILFVGLAVAFGTWLFGLSGKRSLGKRSSK